MLMRRTQQILTSCSMCLKRYYLIKNIPYSIKVALKKEIKAHPNELTKIATKFVRPYSNEAEENELDVNYDELVSVMADDSIKFIDVRERHELEMMGKFHPSAINIPMGELESALEMSPDKFKLFYGCEQPEENDHIVFGCHMGIRSQRALIFARSWGFEKAKHYPGGFQEWTEKQSSDHNG